MLSQVKYKKNFKVTYKCPNIFFKNSKFTSMDKDNFKDENEALGYRIRELRENFVNEKISQEELSFKTGNAKKTIGEIERGNTNPTYQTLLKICKELNITINQLFNFEMDEYIQLSKNYKNRKKK